MPKSDNLRNPDWNWIVVTAMAIILAALLVHTDFSLAAGSLTIPLAAAGALAALSAFYTRVRKDIGIAAAARATAQLIVFTLVATPTSYIAASRNVPFRDTMLSGIDTAVGFDWHGYLAFFQAHPLLAAPLHIAYVTIVPQIAAVTCVLAFQGDLQRLQRTVMAVMLAGAAAVAISAILPAMDAHVFYQVSASAHSRLDLVDPWIHVADVQALRDGSLRVLSIDQLKGIITFPSYHTALAVIVAWGSVRHPATRWPGIALAMLTILATPIDGGHYFADIVAGALVAAAAIMLSALSWKPSPSTRLPLPQFAG